MGEDVFRIRRSRWGEEGMRQHGVIMEDGTKLEYLTAADLEHTRVLGDLRGGHDVGGGVGADHGGYLVHVHHTGDGADGALGSGLVVIDHQLQHLAVDAAGLVHFLDGQAGALFGHLAGQGVGSGDGGIEADLNGVPAGGGLAGISGVLGAGVRRGGGAAVRRSGGAAVLAAAGGQAEDHAEGQEKGQNFFHLRLLLFFGLDGHIIAFAHFFD